MLLNAPSPSFGLRPRLLRFVLPCGGWLDEPLPRPDRQGLIQVVKDASQPQDRRFLEVLLDAPLEFLGDAQD